jgi:hypothetical protein
MSVPGVFILESNLQSHLQNIPEIERTLGAALENLATELRQIDAADYTAFIRIGQMANLRSIVHSSAELHFKAGTLELAELGEIERGWFAPPVITLPMKFRNGGVRVYFRLRLAAFTAAVEVESVAWEDGTAGGDLNQSLRDALCEARIVPTVPSKS